MLSGSNDYVIDGSTKIKNYHKEEVDARCQVEDDKLVLTITGGKAGTVKITRLIKDDKLHVEQVIFLTVTVHDIDHRDKNLNCFRMRYDSYRMKLL